MESMLTSLKAYVAGLIGAVGANTIPPISDWISSSIPAPVNVQQAISIIITAAIVGGAAGGATYAVSNKPKQGAP